MCTEFAKVVAVTIELRYRLVHGFDTMFHAPVPGTCLSCLHVGVIERWSSARRNTIWRRCFSV